MLRSSYCTLYQNSEKDLTELGECPYDQGGYFIVNGSEKVLIAQEKMSTNRIYVFKQRQPNKYAYTAEVRSVAEFQNRPPSLMSVKMLSQTASRKVMHTSPMFLLGRMDLLGSSFCSLELVKIDVNVHFSTLICRDLQGRISELLYHIFGRRSQLSSYFGPWVLLLIKTYWGIFVMILKIHK